MTSNSGVVAMCASIELLKISESLGLAGYILFGLNTVSLCRLWRSLRPNLLVVAVQHSQIPRPTCRKPEKYYVAALLLQLVETF